MAQNPPPANMLVSDFIRQSTKQVSSAYFDSRYPNLDMGTLDSKLTIQEPAHEIKSIVDRVADSKALETKQLAHAVSMIVQNRPVSIDHQNVTFVFTEMPLVVKDFFKLRDARDLATFQLYFRTTGAPTGRAAFAPADYALLVRAITLWKMYLDDFFKKAAEKRNGALQFDILTEAARKVADVMLGEDFDYGQNVTGFMKSAIYQRNADPKDKSRHRLMKSSKREDSRASSVSSVSSRTSSESSSGSQRRARKASRTQTKRTGKKCHNCKRVGHLARDCKMGTKTKKGKKDEKGKKTKKSRHE